MTEADLRALGARGARASSAFTSAVFAKIGLDRYVRAASALGDVLIAWTAAGVSAVRLADDADAFERWYRERFGRTVVPGVEAEITKRFAVEGTAVPVVRVTE